MFIRRSGVMSSTSKSASFDQIWQPNLGLISARSRQPRSKITSSSGDLPVIKLSLHPNTKTALAGVRSKVYTHVWRDHVILPALRIFRARTEGASLDTVPEVAYCPKPRCDGRADKTIAQRGIMGFEPAQARKGYIYNPQPTQVWPCRPNCQ